MGNLLTFEFWFSMYPGSLTPMALRVISAFIIILLALAIFLFISKRKTKGPFFRIIEKLRIFSITNFLIGLILLFFAYETLPLLSMRFWFLLWAILMCVWVGYIVNRLKEIPKIKERRAKEEEYKKYIP